MPFLSSMILPLLAATAEPLALEHFLQRPPAYVPTELAQQASEAPCVVLAERDKAGAVSFLENVSCIPELLQLAESAVTHQTVQAKGSAPYVFRTEIPWAIDKDLAGLEGRAGSYPAELSWRSAPAPHYQGLPSWTHIAAGQVGRCSMLLHVVAGEVLQNTPLNCPAGLQEASEEAVKHWRFAKRGSRDPILLPVTLDFQVADPKVGAEVRESASLTVTVPVSDPTLCYFTLWRDKDEEILGKSPESCPVELWERLDLSSLNIPAAQGSGGAQHLCWSPEQGLITDPPPHSVPPVSIRRSAIGFFPGEDLAESARDCRMLVTLDAEQNAVDVRPLSCHSGLQEEAHKTLLQIQWFRFDRPGFASREQMEVQVPFDGVEARLPDSHAPQIRLIPKKQQEPYYPESAWQDGIEADCAVQMEVNTEGLVTRGSVDSDCPQLFQDAIQGALPKWRFYREDVALLYTLKLQFQLK